VLSQLLILLGPLLLAIVEQADPSVHGVHGRGQLVVSPDVTRLEGGQPGIQLDGPLLEAHQLLVGGRPVLARLLELAVRGDELLVALSGITQPVAQLRLGLDRQRAAPDLKSVAFEGLAGVVHRVGGGRARDRSQGPHQRNLPQSVGHEHDAAPRLHHP
jgi:hypothetical protein